MLAIEGVRVTLCRTVEVDFWRWCEARLSFAGRREKREDEGDGLVEVIVGGGRVGGSLA